MKKHRKLVRVLALVLALLLVGGVLFGTLVSALSEGETASGNRCELTMEYNEEAQALRVSQRLVYVNRTGGALSQVVFYAAGNMLRRETALMYESGDLAEVFFKGYLPGGIELMDVRFNGAPADYGFRDVNELTLRVDCDIAPGESGAFEFEYFILLTGCAAFQGVGPTDVRLSAPALVPGRYDAQYGEFILKTPVAHTRWLDVPAMDYAARLTLPEQYELAATGIETLEAAGDGVRTWYVEAEDARDFAVSFGRRWRAFERTTDSGVRIRLLTNARGLSGKALSLAAEAVDRCAEWFGPFPVAQLDLVQSDYPLDALVFPGAIWLPGALTRANRADDLAHALRVGIAQQYFGLAAYVEPVADAWLSDSVGEYVAAMLLEAAGGHDRFAAMANRDWVPSLQFTVPGGLTVTSDAALFNAEDFNTVVRIRGAVVLHELRLAMGEQALLDGLAAFVRMGAEKDVLTEMDFVHALDEASGGDWEAFLTDWLFNVDDYVDQSIDWYE